MVCVGSSNFPNPETQLQKYRRSSGSIWRVFAVYISFSLCQRHKTDAGKTSSFAIPTCLCNQPYHWFSHNFLVNLFRNHLSILASMPSSVTYTTWIQKNILILKLWQEFSPYITIPIDQKHTDKPLLNWANLHKAFPTAWTIKVLFR